MFMRYTVGGVELPYIVNFPYPVNVQEFLVDLILGLLYPIKFPSPVKFLHPIKASVRNHAHLFESNNNHLLKSSGLKYF